MKRHYTFTSKVWLYPGMAGWHFVGVPKAESTAIKTGVKIKAGFGSVPVEVQVGAQVWTTSIFLDKKSGQYLLPLKAVIRKKEGIYADDSVFVHIKLLL
ncbi:MAG: DUF1905 domain-containing protein [Candidatus Paceibacteria bacterium]